MMHACGVQFIAGLNALLNLSLQALTRTVQQAQAWL